MATVAELQEKLAELRRLLAENIAQNEQIKSLGNPPDLVATGQRNRSTIVRLIAETEAELDELGALSGSTNSATNTLRDLEAREQDLIEKEATVNSAIYANENTLKRKQAELAQATDPEDISRIQEQIAKLQSNLTADQSRLTPIKSQLTSITSQVTGALGAAFPSFSSILPKLPSIPSIPALSSLATLPVSLPVNAAGVLKQLPAIKKIPGVDSAQITGLLGSAATAVSQGIGSVTASNGIGKFGLTPSQLEMQGLLKPGTVDSFISSAPTPVPTQEEIDQAARTGSSAIEIAKNRQLNNILSSPSIWTGKDGVRGLSALTSNENLQSVTQQNIMGSSLNQLKSLGVVKGGESADQLGTLMQTATKFGAVATAAWTSGKAPADLVGPISNVAKNAQQALNLVDTKIPNFGSLPFDAAGKIGTLDRKSVDGALTSVIGNPKIPLPNYNSDDSATSTSIAAQKAAIAETESKLTVYKDSKENYGILDPKTQAAFAEYKAAIAKLDALG